MNAAQPICERHALPAHLCEHEHAESDAEFSEQVQREACSREVWSADEVPFLVALEVVLKAFSEAEERMRANGHTDWQSIFLSRVSGGKPRFTIYGDSNSSAQGDTLSEAIEKLGAKNTAKAQKLAALRAEIRALESDETDTTE